VPHRAVQSIERLDSEVGALVAQAMAGTGDNTVVTDAHLPAVLSMPLAFLLYLGISASEQIKVLLRATVRSFMAGNEEAVIVADEVASHVSVLGSKYTAEDIVAMVMGQWMLPIAHTYDTHVVIHKEEEEPAPSPESDVA